jgi:hypothetical protein
MRSVVFDDQGEMWGDTPRRLPEILQGRLSGAEAINYAVRNLGYVAVTENNGSARVRIRPAVASPIAFSALCYHLAETKPDRILISWLDSTWQDKLFGSLQDAIRHMLDLLPAIDSGRAHDFKSRTRSIDRIPAANPLVTLFNLWLEARGPIQPERLDRLIREGLQGRYVIVQTGRSKADVYLREVGRGFLSYDDQWLSKSHGLRVEDQPDYFYGKWVAEAYRMTKGDGTPRLEDVDAIINKPGAGRSRVRYTRLIVPLQLSLTNECLLGASLIDPAIDLRPGVEAS